MDEPPTSSKVNVNPNPQPMSSLCPLKILFLFEDVEKGVKMGEPSTSSKANVPGKKKIKEVCPTTISLLSQTGGAHLVQRLSFKKQVQFNWLIVIRGYSVILKFCVMYIQYTWSGEGVILYSLINCVRARVIQFIQ